MGIKPIDKIYKITDNEHTISCLVYSGGSWYPRYRDTYLTWKGRDAVIARFIDAIERKGYKKAELAYPNILQKSA